MSVSTLGIGSGLDLNGTLSQLASAERLKLRPYQIQESQITAKLSSFGSIKSTLTGLQEALGKLKEADSFSQFKSNFEGENFAVKVEKGAQPGNYDVDVVQIAETHSIATQGYADKDANLGAGTITITKNDGTTFDFALTEDESSLEDIKAKINENAEEQGFTASIINDGTEGAPNRLLIKSNESGEAASFTVSVDDGDGDANTNHALVLDNNTKVQGRNALVKIDGIERVSQSNEFENIAEGVSITVEEVGTYEFDVEQDDDGIKDLITGFVDAYNDYNKTVRKERRFEGVDAPAGVLLGNGSLRSIENNVNIAMTSDTPDSAFGLLSDLGIERKLDGSLEIDDEVFDEILEKDADEIAKFFAGEGEEPGETGFVASLDGVLEEILKEEGTLETISEGLQFTLDRIDDRKANIERSIDATIERYRVSFSRLDSTVASLNSVGDQLIGQLNSIASAYNNKGK